MRKLITHPCEATHVTEMPSDDVRVDVVMYPSGEVKAVPAGKGADVVRSYHERGREESALRRAVPLVVIALILAYSLLIVRSVLLGLITAVLVYVADRLLRLLPLLTDSDAAVLDSDISLRDAREQWDAAAVEALASPGERERRDAREHAFE